MREYSFNKVIKTSAKLPAVIKKNNERKIFKYNNIMIELK